MEPVVQGPDPRLSSLSLTPTPLSLVQLGGGGRQGGDPGRGGAPPSLAPPPLSLVPLGGGGSLGCDLRRGWALHPERCGGGQQKNQTPLMNK